MEEIPAKLLRRNRLRGLAEKLAQLAHAPPVTIGAPFGQRQEPEVIVEVF
jgi:hypothetical protein